MDHNVWLKTFHWGWSPRSWPQSSPGRLLSRSLSTLQWLDSSCPVPSGSTQPSMSQRSSQFERARWCPLLSHHLPGSLTGGLPPAALLPLREGSPVPRRRGGICSWGEVMGLGSSHLGCAAHPGVPSPAPWSAFQWGRQCRASGLPVIRRVWRGEVILWGRQLLGGGGGWDGFLGGVISLKIELFAEFPHLLKFLFCWCKTKGHYQLFLSAAFGS